MKTDAIIVAAGSGERLNEVRDKPFIMLAGKPLLAHTIAVFSVCNQIDRIILAVKPSKVDYVQKNIVDYYKLQKVAVIVAGGAQRQDSVRNALAAVSDEADYVLIHDGARPFVRPDLITRLLESVRTEPAVSCGLPLHFSVKTCDEAGYSAGSLDRTRIWEIQTPQIFERELICAAHAAAQREGFEATDDAALVEQYGQRVKLIAGDRRNIKITTPHDVAWAEFILNHHDTGGADQCA